MASISSVVGITSASVSASALRMIMKRMRVVSSVRDGLLVGGAPGFFPGDFLGRHDVGEVGRLEHAAQLDRLALFKPDALDPLERLVLGPRGDDPEAGDQLLGLGERSILDLVLATIEG